MFWKKNNCEDILKNAPGPSPWYLREFPPEVGGWGIMKNVKGAFYNSGGTSFLRKMQ